MPVFDGRKAKIKGLWKRGGKYYARFKIAFPGEDCPKARTSEKTRRLHFIPPTYASSRRCANL